MAARNPSHLPSELWKKDRPEASTGGRGSSAGAPDELRPGDVRALHRGVADGNSQILDPRRLGRRPRGRELLIDLGTDLRGQRRDLLRVVGHDHPAAGRRRHAAEEPFVEAAVLEADDVQGGTDAGQRALGRLARDGRIHDAVGEQDDGRDRVQLRAKGSARADEAGEDRALAYGGELVGRLREATHVGREADEALRGGAGDDD